MTAEEWDACTDTDAMLRQLRGKVSDRKLRFFSCAVCRRIAPRMSSGYLQAVRAAEMFADGRASAAALERRAGQNAATAADAWFGAREYARPGLYESWGIDRPAVASLFRCIFGNPFRTLAVPPAWRDWQGGTVVRLARAAYDRRRMPAGTLDPARLAVLADALEEAGCPDPLILGHLRETGDHVRGCHVIDSVLGRT
jgi:hypothetical protein